MDIKIIRIITILVYKIHLYHYHFTIVRRYHRRDHFLQLQVLLQEVLQEVILCQQAIKADIE